MSSTHAYTFSRTDFAILLGLFLLALLPRLYSAQTVGWHWDYPGSFTLVNYDEGGSCRAALDGFNYSPFIGAQTIALAALSGNGPPQGIAGNQRAVKAYCHSPQHLLIARSYSALTGALTVVAVALLCLQLVPSTSAIAWTAAALLALSGFHISESQSATVDAPSVFFIYSFLALLAWLLRLSWSGGVKRWLLLGLSLPWLMAAIWAKFWVFALIAYAVFVPASVWAYALRGFSVRRLCAALLILAIWFAALANYDFPHYGYVPILLFYGLLIPWRKLPAPMALFWGGLPLIAYLLLQNDLVYTYTHGGGEGRFGSGYGAIGDHKWLRNLTNIPAVLLVGLGIPACVFIPLGVKHLFSTSLNKAWLVLLPVLAFALFMAFLAPVTYYRHYLSLLPAAAILAAVGLFASGWAQRRWFMLLFFAWPALLAFDLVSDYHTDPRIALRPWFDERPQARVFSSFYVNPPPNANSALFRPEYAQGSAQTLKQADYLLLSESWYDTAFSNELNGPLVLELDHLVKTKPEYAQFYRQALADENAHLELIERWDLPHFMPELLLHRYAYGNFTLFVGDLRIFRVLK